MVQPLEDGYRLNIRLTDAATQQNLWTERFDFGDGNRPAAQLEIAQEVSESLSVQLVPEELNAIKLGQWDLIEAEALYDQALAIMNPPNDPRRLDAAEILMRRIIELSPGKSHGFSGTALIMAYEVSFGHVENSQEIHSENRGDGLEGAGH